MTPNYHRIFTLAARHCAMWKLGFSGYTLHTDWHPLKPVPWKGVK